MKNMKQVSVFRTDKDGSIYKVKIVAPEGKEMVFDPSLLQHGVLSLGEYGQSGLKIAAFRNWDQALFCDAEGEGYKIEAKKL
jgi:hypothetical protein